jgi:SpoVK/Ycf46/Vps4 family AAA+-type ATPase
MLVLQLLDEFEASIVKSNGNTDVCRIRDADIEFQHVSMLRSIYHHTQQFPRFWSALTSSLPSQYSDLFIQIFDERLAELRGQSYQQHTSSPAPIALEFELPNTDVTSSTSAIDATIRGQAIRVLNHHQNFCSVAGMEQLKLELFEAFVFPRLRLQDDAGVIGNADKQMRPLPARSAILHGLPGNGKTYILQALAGELQCLTSQSMNWSFLPISPAVLLSKWTGESEKAIVSIFRVAIELAPCVLFIDEIDALGPSREACERSDMTTRRMVSQLLVESEKLTVADNVVFVAATNCIALLDAALLRRFDKVLEVPLPAAETRLQLLEFMLDGVQHALTTSQLESMATNDLAGLSMAEIRLVCQDAINRPLRSVAERAYHQTRRHNRCIQSSCEKFRTNVEIDETLPVSAVDFTHALRQMRARKALPVAMTSEVKEIE